MVTPKRIFISHAGEDKEPIARPLADALIGAGFRVWFDKYSLHLGDSLKAKIDEGLAMADFGVVILSPAFFSKQWPKEELDGLVAIETARKAKVVLPVWHDLSFEDVARYSPTLAGKLGIKSDEGIEEIVIAITRSINNATVFAARDDLDYDTVHIPVAMAGEIDIAKLPEESWEGFGNKFLEEMRRLDRERKMKDEE